ncbi:M20 family metallopeptidase [Methylobacterium sp. E-045]|uniref:M20 family metallopeptidase n=1 Tax=Methylobacterium sp. E-045 TaxID=2836575 RepID=UPI001FBAAB99|nr:M20 family metallopeptidase [Methylobacterium sp. E-045]MCJ2128160.1 M20 family metallopeptidase [Methylobacterium sp. E-045]
MEQDNFSDTERRVLEKIDEHAWLALACALIPAGQPEAENPLDPDEPPAREEAAALFIAGLLEDMGLSVDLVAKRPGRPNVIAVLPGSDPQGPSLILNDHLDTYPAGDWSAWTMTNGHPFKPTRHGGRLYARGTSDTRGNLACTLLAVRAIQEAGIRLKGSLSCVYTVDEEKNGPDGSIFLLDEHGLRADYTIVCEPTGWSKPDGSQGAGRSWGMGIAVANGGHVLVEVETRGVKTHLWRPDTGVNAVAKMARLLPALETMTFAHEPARLAGGTPPRTTILRVSGGLPREMQFTPDLCRAVMAVVGILPGMSVETVMADIDAVIASAAAADPELRASTRPYPGALFVDGTLEQDEAAQPTAAIARSYERLLGEAPQIYRKNAFNDTIRFAERGHAAVTFGPGEDGWPPVNEYIDIAKAVAATRILALTVLDLLGSE